MDGPEDYRAKWKISYNIAYMWNLKKKMIKQKQTHRVRKQRGRVTKRERWWTVTNWEFGFDMHILFKINNQ